MVNEPVLVIAFNRPDHLKRLIERLRVISTSKIYVAIDGPRPEKHGEIEKVEACKRLINEIDWPCSVTTNFREHNLGCGLGVSSAITWFFTHEERGIILEDDILPSHDFFKFCEDLLKRYARDPKVFAISGCNFVPPDGQTRPQDSFRFSQIPHIWGWATWKDRWDNYSLDIAGWRSQITLRKLWKKAGGDLPSTVYWASTFELLARKEVDTWDGQLVLCSMINGALTATSNVNLISNIGFDSEATHTFEDRNDLQPIMAMEFPLSLPPRIEVDAKADKWTRKHHFRATWRGMLEQGDRYLRRRKPSRSRSA
jgi:hypothetical protein